MEYGVTECNEDSHGGGVRDPRGAAARANELKKGPQSSSSGLGVHLSGLFVIPVALERGNIRINCT